MNTGILKIGDNVEIRILQQVEQGWKTGDRPDSYASKIQNILDNGDIEIDMPTRGGKNASLPSGVRLEFLFYTHVGIYQEPLYQGESLSAVNRTQNTVRKISASGTLPV